MPFLRFDVPGATLSDDVIQASEHEFPSYDFMVKLRHDQSLDTWRFIDKYRASGILTFQTYTGWALRLPPHTFEPHVEFQKQDVRQDMTFGDWTKWTAVSGVMDINDSEEMLTFGQETKIDRDTAFSVTTVEQAAPATNFSFLDSDTAEFRIWLPSNATALKIILNDGGDSFEFDVYEPLTDDWNLVRIELDQPSATNGSPNLNSISSIQVQVTFGDAVDSAFYIASMELDRTSDVGGEVRWQLSFDEGTTWVGWNPVSDAWETGVWCHSQWIERYMQYLTPSTYNNRMSMAVRCQLRASSDRKYTPFVWGVMCGIDFDPYLHWENDIKRSVLRHCQAIEILIRGVEEGDGSNTVSLRSHFSSPVVESVYYGGVRDVNTTEDIFQSQSGSNITLTTAVAAGDKVVIHYKATPPVKIAADRFLIEAAVPEIDLSFPSITHSVRHSIPTESFVNRSLGRVYIGRGVNYQSIEMNVYCTANDAATVADMVDAVMESFRGGFESDGTGFTLNVDDMLPAELGSEHKNGLHVRQINSEITAVRWDDLQLTEERQVRSFTPRPSLLPNVGYRGG